MDDLEEGRFPLEITPEHTNEQGSISVTYDSFGTYGYSMPNVVPDPLLKIETLHASQLTGVTVVYVLSMFYMVAFTVVFLAMANTSWLIPITLGSITYHGVIPTLWFRIFEFAVEVLVSLALIGMLCFYLGAVLATPKRNRTREMGFVFVLGLSCSVIYMPVFNTVFLPPVIVNDPSWLPILRVSTILSSCVGITGIILYIWSTAISFRTKRRSWFHWTYWPKMFFLVLYLIIRILVSFFANINFNWLMLSSLPVGIQIMVAEHTLSPGLLFLLVANLVQEMIIVACIEREIRLTDTYIRSLDYLDYRSLQIGFRQFKYYLATTFILTIIFGLLNIMLSSNDLMVILAKYQGVYQLRPSSGRLSYLTLIPAFALQQLFFMLPASAPRLVDLIRCRYKSSHSPTESLFRYRVFERKDDPKFKSTSFVMETCISLFNLAWLPYSYGKAQKQTRTPQDFGDHKNKVVSYVCDQETDTHALVLEAEDRIVVAFRGTSSTKNVGTDLRTRRVRVDVLDNEIPESSGRYCRRRNTSLVHKGFLNVYETVRKEILEELQRLYGNKPRPIFFTGHSLGGALATLCSYDVSKRMHYEEGIFVYTFGSPRVGNLHFVNEYNALVPCAWRLVNSHDPVAKMPPAFLFHHVGQSALVTANGELFIDPTMFEMTFMHSSFLSLGLKHHTNSGYAKALTAFVERRHGNRMGYRGVIWKAKLLETGSHVGGTSGIPTGLPVPSDAFPLSRILEERPPMAPASSPISPALRVSCEVVEKSSSRISPASTRQASTSQNHSSGVKISFRKIN
ncbi:hypothetical protein NDN08_003305 [Rhodosorus marinus]|uniref:Fungal lipase-type domain-containing protein n=1 Tax=Rhodosorus marinus TaxID=101924 RepID=A0AAV8UXP3_9RHOD|nr:hypothetical protein NDN08_003305 [Rhodosorus marinus]